MDGDNLNWSIDFYETNITQCNQVLGSMGDFDKIPLVRNDNLQHFKDGDLVRYQGMVQDMLNPEYYYPSYILCNINNGEKTVKSGKYRDIAPCQDNEELKFDGMVPGERLVFFCIPVPGMSPWVQNHMKNTTRDFSAVSGSSCKKREMEDDKMDEEMPSETPGTSDACQSKKICDKKVIEGVQPNESHSSDNYFPLNEMNGLPCIMKIYKKEDECNVILNDRIEVVGFLSLNPALESNWDGCDAEDKALNPPPSLVPRIHAIFSRKLIHCNPLLNQNINGGEIMASAEKVRSDLHLILTQVLYGDALAADYLICHLLSRVYSRNDGQALGKLSLNICNVKNETYCRRLCDVLESLVTNLQYIPLTIESLNEKTFVPRKDYETNRLWSGRLQLCDDTYVVLDETKMNEGKLDNTGCTNIAALQNLMRNQDVNYDFSYYSVKYDTDSPVMVLSEGKSMFETDIRIKLRPEPSMPEEADETFDAAGFFLSGETSERIRMYLTCMRLQDFEMSDELMRRIGNDYVALRQQKNGFTSNDLHTLLVLSRVLALSHGRTSLTDEDWSRALEMESERKGRLG